MAVHEFKIGRYIGPFRLADIKISKLRVTITAETHTCMQPRL